MSISTITVGTATLTLVSLPLDPAPAMIEPWISDRVGSVQSPFSGQLQTQTWPGADTFGMTVTLPPLQETAPDWQAFLMQMRGMERVVQLGQYPLQVPRGNPGSSVPVVDGTVGTNNIPMSRVLYTRGWTPSVTGLLQPFDALQIGYRLHWCLDTVSSDSSGKASFEVFPSIREQPTDGTAIVLNNPKGLFRLAQNRRNWSVKPDQTALSYQLQEYR